MAEIAALADVHIAAGELERGVGFQRFSSRNRVLDHERRKQLDCRTDQDRDQSEHRENHRKPFELAVGRFAGDAIGR